MTRHLRVCISCACCARGQLPTLVTPSHGRRRGSLLRDRTTHAIANDESLQLWRPETESIRLLYSQQLTREVTPPEIYKCIPAYVSFFLLSTTLVVQGEQSLGVCLFERNDIWPRCLARWFILAVFTPSSKVG